jgi:hypothetical protein
MWQEMCYEEALVCGGRCTTLLTFGNVLEDLSCLSEGLFPFIKGGAIE